MCTDWVILIMPNGSNRQCEESEVAVITGSKDGYHISLMLLRGGATVIATTVFRWTRRCALGKKFHGLGTQLENSRIRFETHSQCRDILQFY
jgi:hypothetical protein